MCITSTFGPSNQIHEFFRKSNHPNDKRWSQKTRDLDDLPVGTPVSIQNQTGNHPNKWDKTGIILENQPHSKVVIRVDGSRRITTRNRRFVRQLNPALRMEASPKSVMRKEKKRKVPVQEDPINEVPSVDVLQDPPRYVQVGVEDHQVPCCRGDERGT